MEASAMEQVLQLVPEEAMEGDGYSLPSVDDLSGAVELFPLADYSSDLGGGCIPPGTLRAHQMSGLGICDLLTWFENTAQIALQVTQPGEILVIDMEDEQSIRVQMAADASQASRLVFDGEHVHKGVSRADDLAKRLTQVGIGHIPF